MKNADNNMHTQRWSKKYDKPSSLPIRNIHFLSDSPSLPVCVHYMQMFPKEKKNKTGHATNNL